MELSATAYFVASICVLLRVLLSNVFGCCIDRRAGKVMSRTAVDRRDSLNAIWAVGLVSNRSSTRSEAEYRSVYAILAETTHELEPLKSVFRMS